ncbi:GDSL-like Lipase/Acylhydrolase superfamily protein [Hibiscus syriacus]|uniref:GDSL-like Lipase/Acylhydrolase superfamily protein n=1 Tax=Hibiscus syriacus TaxID=106335 RepID=A0A6A3A576_HIBSY|nr:GDSL-like Lipase/Acylhydrolase superfamily protein [Hibiscus syriacus]
MAMVLPPSATAIFFIILAMTVPRTVYSISYSQYRTLVSLSQSLLTRVSNLRSARGDVDGSNRARLIAEKLERWQGVGLWGTAWSIRRDYVWKYGWGRYLDYTEIFGVASDLNQLGKMLGELTRSYSEMERASWVAGNYKSALTISKRMFNRLVKVFKKSVRSYFDRFFNVLIN